MRGDFQSMRPLARREFEPDGVARCLCVAAQAMLFAIAAGCGGSDGTSAPIGAEPSGAAGTSSSSVAAVNTGSGTAASAVHPTAIRSANPQSVRSSAETAPASSPRTSKPIVSNPPTAAVDPSAKDPPNTLTDLSASGPVVLSGQHDLTISGKRISNPNGHCIEIRGGSTNIKITGSQIGPCGEDGVFINGSSNITVERNIFTDTGTLGIRGSGSAVEFEQSEGLVVRANRMERVASGVYAPISKRILVEHNTVRNLQGPMPRGQMVQFNGVNGAGNAVRCNVLENVSGLSGAVEDHISMFASNGAPDDPIVIEHNRTKGGESIDSSGCGVVIGDVSGGQHFRVRGNVFVNTGNCGIGLTGGSDVEITDNTVVSRGQRQANVGLLAWNLYGKGCAGNTFARNRVFWDSSMRNGAAEHWWDGAPDKSCQPLLGWDTNLVDDQLSEAVFDEPIAACE